MVHKEQDYCKHNQVGISTIGGSKKMINNVNLTDDELSVIVTSLELTMKSYESFIQKGNQPDQSTIKAYEDIKLLFGRLTREYF